MSSINANESSSLMHHRISDLLYAITTDLLLFDPIYQGNVTLADLLDTSSIYVYDTFNDLS
jgi:hypothetical protein